MSCAALGPRFRGDERTNVASSEPKHIARAYGLQFAAVHGMLRPLMIRFASIAVAALAGLLLADGVACAHPHVWVTMKSEIVYAPDGSITGVRHAWTFDDMFSAFAVQGLEDNPPEPAKDKAAQPAGAKAQAQSGLWSWLHAAWNWMTGAKSTAPAGDKPAVATETVQAGPAQLKEPADPKRLTRAQLQPLAEVNVTSLKEYDFFTYAKVNGKKTTFVEPKDYYLEQNDGLLTLHFLLPFESPTRTQTLELDVLDPSYFVDFAFAEKDAAALSGAPANCRLAVRKPQDMSPEMAQRLAQIAPDQQIPQDTFGAQFANKLSVKCQ